jgi:hypothetical protein
VDLDERDVERARSSLDDANFDVSATQQGQVLGFQIIDPPQMPTETRQSLRKLLVFPAAAIVAGLGLSAMLLLLLVIIDQSARSASDLSPHLPVLAVVPRFSFDRRQQADDPDGARHAMESVVTSALALPAGSEQHGLSV